MVTLTKYKWKSFITITISVEVQGVGVWAVTGSMDGRSSSKARGR